MEIPQIPDAALLHGAVMSLDLLWGGGIPAFPDHLSMASSGGAGLLGVGLKRCQQQQFGVATIPRTASHGCCVGAHALVWGKAAASHIGQKSGISIKHRSGVEEDAAFLLLGCLNMEISRSRSGDV